MEINLLDLLYTDIKKNDLTGCWLYMGNDTSSIASRRAEIYAAVKLGRENHTYTRSLGVRCSNFRCVSPAHAKSTNIRLDINVVAEIIALHRNGLSAQQIADRYDISTNAASGIIRGRTRRDVRESDIVAAQQRLAESK